MAEYIIRETWYPGAVKQEIVGELIRCKDCVNFASSWGEDYCLKSHFRVDEEWYCADAEREDDDS